MGNVLVFFFRGLFRFLKLHLLWGKKCRKRNLKKDTNLITVILNKEPEQLVGDIKQLLFMK